MALVPIKSVRIRGDEKTNKPGGLDGRLVLNKKDKDRVVIVYLSDTDTTYSNFIPGTFTKKDWGEKSDDDVIKAYLNSFPKWKIIQDPYDANNIPPDSNYKPNPPGATASSGVTASVAGVTASNTGTASTSTLATATVPQAPINKFITGKVTITKKSGPGEITGVTEIELTDPNETGTTSATFKGLQFTEGGDYVLSITSTSSEVEPMELKVKVIKEDDIIGQPDSKGSNTEEKPVDGNRPIIAQIDKPTIKVPAIKMKQDGTGPSGQGAYTDGLGYNPFIWYKGYSIEERYISNLRLYHVGIVPKVEFTFTDTNDILKGEFTPTDDSTFDLFLNSTSSNLKSIHMVFKIESFDQGGEKSGQKYTIVGTVHVPNLYLVGNNSYNDTSFSTLRKICGELELGFNSNITNTDDKMAWRNTNKKMFEFMSDIVGKSYISDESFMVGYIDYYYCFNYVDIEKEMNRDASKDISIDTSGLSQQGQGTSELTRLIPLKLTNDKTQTVSSNYISEVIRVNDSTKKSLKEGYATITKFYDRIKKQFLVFTVDSTTSDGSKSIILKGDQYDDKYQKANVKHNFAGKIDTDNVHTNFNYASTQNRINLNNLNKIALNVTLPNANWNLYKFQKVDVQLFNQTSTPANPAMMDFRYSGYYIIADIEYFWVKGKMSQKLRLVRKELGKTPEEIKNAPPVKAPAEVKENNPNPTGATSSIVPAPNSVYNVGENYLVQDKNGKLYNLTVTQLLQDGIQVTGTLVESPVGMSASSTSNTSTTGINPATSSNTQGSTLN
jgi:hypothetical protein